MNRIEKLIYRLLVTKFNNNKRPIPITVFKAETGLGDEEISKVLKTLAIDNSITLNADKTISVMSDVFAPR